MTGTPTEPRLHGEARRVKAAQFANEYNAGASLRGLAAAHGRSYGLARALVIEGGGIDGGGRLRGRGGARPSPRGPGQNTEA
ncbi:helix-turn-helix domain-containing protein [Streptomyces sp. NPDC001552]|uniref:helix-turn-helix domain-containing protein n=1 Tax=Streptomyces sp. NPDC001552 TaxID=3364587 RepID=UPI0036D12315